MPRQTPLAARPRACASTSSAPKLPGKLLETGTTSLDLLEDGRRTPIVCAPNGSTYFAFPAFSPDGTKLAYVLSLTPTAAGQDWGDDIYTAAADGSGARPVLKHDAPGVSINALTWTPDGAAVVYGYTQPVYNGSGNAKGLVSEVRSLRLADGAVSTLIKNGGQPAFSWDGKQLVFVAVSPNHPNVSALGIAKLDGSGLRAVLGFQAGYQSYFAPHLSPDGGRVVFAAIGGAVGNAGNEQQATSNETSLPGPLPILGEGAGPHPGPLPILGEGAARGPGPLDRIQAAIASWLGAPVASADGTLYEVWVANLDGSDLHAVANLREDLPFPLWSSNGKQILFLGSAALYVANADGSGVKPIDKGVPHGQIAWYQP